MTSALASFATTLFPASSPSPPPGGASSSSSHHRVLTSSLALAAAAAGLRQKVSRSAAVVIELGERWTKMGFAGESAPRHVVDTCAMLREVRPASDLALASIAAPHLSPRALGLASLELSQSPFLLSNPFHTPAMFSSLLPALLRLLYQDYLCVNARDRRLVLLERAGGWSQSFRRALVSAALGLDVPALCVRSSLECCLYLLASPSPSLSGPSPLSSSFSTRSGLLVDIGAGETRLVPFHAGYPLGHLACVVPIGARHCFARVRGIFASTLRAAWTAAGGGAVDSAFLAAEERVLDEAKLDSLLVGQSFVQPLRAAWEGMVSPSAAAGEGLVPPQRSLTGIARALTFSTGVAFASGAVGGTKMPSVSVPARARSEGFEAYFSFAALNPVVSAPAGSSSPSAADSVASEREAEHSLPLSILSLLLDARLDPSVRSAVLGNIVLSGGGVMVPGLAQRLVEEVSWLLGGGVVPGEEGLSRRVKEAGMNKLASNVRASTVSSAVRSPLSASPPHQACFHANVMGWTGGSLYASLEGAEDDFLPAGELRPFVEGRVVAQSAVDERKLAGEQRRAATRKIVRADGTEEKREQPVPAADPVAAESDGEQVFVQLRPLPFPDTSVDAPLRAKAATSSAASATWSATHVHHGPTSSITLSTSHASGLSKHRSVLSVIGESLLQQSRSAGPALSPTPPLTTPDA